MCAEAKKKMKVIYWKIGKLIEAKVGVKRVKRNRKWDRGTQQWKNGLHFYPNTL